MEEVVRNFPEVAIVVAISLFIVSVIAIFIAAKFFCMVIVDKKLDLPSIAAMSLWAAISVTSLRGVWFIETALGMKIIP